MDSDKTIRTITHNTAIQLVGKVVSTALGLLAVALLTRYLGLEKFGWYAIALGFTQFIGILADFGFTVTISNMLAEPKFEKRTVLNTVFTWRLITAGIMHGLAPFIFLFFPYPLPVKIAGFIISISFLAAALNNIFIGWYRTALAMWRATIAEVLGRVLLVAGFLIVSISKLGFYSMMIAVSLSAILSTLYLYFHVGKIKLEINREISKDMFYKMWPTALAITFNSIYLQGDRVILPLFATAETVGLYSLSYRVLDVILQVSAMVMGLIMPLITFAASRGLKEQFREQYQLALNMLSLLLLPIAVGIFTLAEPIMRLFVTSEFSQAKFILRGLSISIIGTCFGMVFGHVALAINKQKEVLWVYISDAIISLIGYLIFIPRLGALGAIGVTIFSEFYAGLLLMILTIYYSREKPKFFAVAKITLASLLMGLFITAWPNLPLLPAIIIGGGIYALLILAFRVVPIKTVISLFKREAFVEPVNV